MKTDAGVRVWDPVVRIFHWALVIAFFVAFFTEDDTMLVHAWAGYVVGALIVVRVLWGIVGPRHARFADFVYRPRTVVAYTKDLLKLRGRRYLGHSPAGGAMVVALIVVLAGTVGTGLVVYAAEDNAGPLAGMFAVPSAEFVAPADRDDDDDERSEYRGEDEHEESAFVEAFEEAHEVLANLAFALVIVHILGVLWASLAHRENLARAMVTGRKRPLAG